MANLPDSATHLRQPRRAAASGWIGSALEYYDFFIYATAASLVFPQIFFPSQNPTIAIIASLATYGVGYVARPIGAFVLGHWGDTHGRKNVLLLCMFLMGFSTMAVGLLPTYQQVGILAPALLVILRLIQGFAVAGEISGASSMILEHSPFGRRGYYASFSLQGVQAGQILAAAIFLPLAAYMPTEAFNSWGWRIPFLLSVVVIIAGYIIRREVHETPAFESEEEKGAVPRTPIVQAFKESWPDILRVACMALMNVIPVVATICGPGCLRHWLFKGGLPLDTGGRQHHRSRDHSVRWHTVRQYRPPPTDHRRIPGRGPGVIRIPLCNQYSRRLDGDCGVAVDVGCVLPGL
jgi:MFS family permease